MGCAAPRRRGQLPYGRSVHQQSRGSAHGGRSRAGGSLDPHPGRDHRGHRSRPHGAGRRARDRRDGSHRDAGHRRRALAYRACRRQRGHRPHRARGAGPGRAHDRGLRDLPGAVGRGDDRAHHARQLEPDRRPERRSKDALGDGRHGATADPRRAQVREVRARRKRDPKGCSAERQFPVPDESRGRRGDLRRGVHRRAGLPGGMGPLPREPGRLPRSAAPGSPARGAGRHHGGAHPHPRALVPRGRDPHAHPRRGTVRIHDRRVHARHGGLPGGDRDGGARGRRLDLLRLVAVQARGVRVDPAQRSDHAPARRAHRDQLRHPFAPALHAPGDREAGEVRGRERAGSAPDADALSRPDDVPGRSGRKPGGRQGR